MPIRRGDGTTIAPKGYQEVRKGDGTVLWSADGSSGGGETVPDEQNLLAHWDFSEASANDGETYTAVADSSENENELTGEGATHATDSINGLSAAHFNGTDSYLQGPTSSAIDLGSTSAEISVYVVWQSHDPSHNGYMLSQTNGSGGVEQGFSHIHHGGNNDVRFRLGGDQTGIGSPLDTAPHKTAARINRPDGSGIVSIDDTTLEVTAGTVDDTGQPLRVGAVGDSSGTGGTTFFNGYIGEILIYDGQHDDPTHDEVMGYLDRWFPEPESDVPDLQNLRAHWDFSQASASDGEAYTSVADLSGNGHYLAGEGATHAADGINGLPSAHFNGTDGVLYGPHTSELDLRNDDTVKSIYLVWQSLDGGQTGYIMTQTENGSPALQGFAHLFYGSSDTVRFHLGGDRPANSDLFDTDPHTTAALIDRPSGEATVSWDGELESTTTGPETSAETEIRIGARYDVSSGEAVFFNGYIGEILIYDGRHDAATHDEIMDHLSRWTQ